MWDIDEMQLQIATTHLLMSCADIEASAEQCSAMPRVWSLLLWSSNQCREPASSDSSTRRKRELIGIFGWQSFGTFVADRKSTDRSVHPV
jgi:hypothetical protein